MSRGISLVGSSRTEGRLRPRVRADWLAEVRDYIAARCADDPVETWIDDASLSIAIHPAADPVLITIEGSTATLLATTNHAGPGYHAFVCELATGIQEHVDCPWGDTKSVDETGYWGRSDFPALQAEMLHWLHELCKHILSDLDSGGSWQVGMPAATVPAANPLDVVTTALGPRSQE